jgi:cellulose synthase/poly-beta-1,6-N-acetylglucosamine synthase-like glycosyltransferase
MISDITSIITYLFLFLSLNFEIFFLISYFENREKIKAEEENQSNVNLKNFPSTTVIVPCWNEEMTVTKTVESLLELDYPKDKLKLMLIDDGSTDGTWKAIQKFKENPQVEIFTKQNGGKYSALNFGLSKLKTDLVGCLDADSYVERDSLKKIVMYFEDNETMAVAPSIKLWEHENVLQKLQKVEYAFGIFTRKMFHYMDAIYITPGPFSIFRKEVFENLGGYKHAHNTEDIEIALRMQRNGYKISHAHEAWVYTIPPRTLSKLLKQRVRWSYGFIKNAIDYKDMIFNKKYGNLGLFVLPMACISIFSVLFVSSMFVLNLVSNATIFAYETYTKFQSVGMSFNLKVPNLDLFYLNTEIMFLLGIVVSIGSISMIILSKRMTEKKLDIGMDLVYYLSLYMFIAPIWIGKAVYNVVLNVNTTWR